MSARRLSVAAILVALAAGACGGWSDAERAFREGRFGDAQRAFAAIEDAAGDGAPAVLAYDRALAALRAGDLRDAEAAVARAEARADGALAPFVHFLRGNVAFAKSELAEVQADTPEAEPFAWDVAIVHAETARRSWRLAVTEREDRADWPEARRNVERALLRIADLREKKADAEKRRKRRNDPKPKPRPRPPAPERPAPEQDAAKARGGELSPEEVAKLFEAG